MRCDGCSGFASGVEVGPLADGAKGSVQPLPERIQSRDLQTFEVACVSCDDGAGRHRIVACDPCRYGRDRSGHRQCDATSCMEGPWRCLTVRVDSGSQTWDREGPAATPFPPGSDRRHSSRACSRRHCCRRRRRRTIFRAATLWSATRGRASHQQDPRPPEPTFRLQIQGRSPID